MIDIAILLLGTFASNKTLLPQSHHNIPSKTYSINNLKANAQYQVKNDLWCIFAILYNAGKEKMKIFYILIR